MRRRTRRWLILSAVVAGVGVAAIAIDHYVSGPVVPYVPHDASLRTLPLYFYPAEEGDSTHPRAFVFFLGNDVAFWRPHEELSFRLAGEGYAVVGLDNRKFLGALPSGVAERDSAYRTDIVALIARTRHELHADSAPVILAGHSSGAETALWIAAHVPPHGLKGVLAMSPRSSGHLRVTAADLANAEPSGPGSYSTIALTGSLPDSIRVALVRGEHDPFARYDSAFVAAGPDHVRLWRVPFAGHSLQRLLIVGPMVDHAVEWILRAG